MPCPLGLIGVKVHEQQVQYLQAELRTVNETLATKQQEAVHTLQETRGCWAICRAPRAICTRCKKRYGAYGRSRMNWGVCTKKAHRGVGPPSGRARCSRTAVQQFSTSNEQLQAKVDELLTAKQQL
ncbi:MAG: hypothetical protein Q7K57_47735 [Burkholderiaceae bacterium]|nr:hypothetical protein [Burkholderiaceae bacterium]